jgi:hypothetical protein
VAAPLILIVGSAQDGRADYDPPVNNAPAARAAAAQIGTALAKKGCRLVVYSSDPAYIEAPVVAGFLAGAKARARDLIQVRSPAGVAGAQFTRTPAQAGLFEHHPDADPDWEGSFYRSLRDADGILIIGGGRSAVVIGRLALAFSWPIIALATFGGAAQRVWERILEQDLPSPEEHNLMARPDWRNSYADELVDALLAQIARRKSRARADRLRPGLRTAAGLVLLILVVAMLIVASGADLFTALLYAVGPVAGAGAALGRSIWAPDETDRPVAATLLLGFLAGLAASLVYLVAQVTAANGATSGIKPVAILWVAVTGLGAGFALDRVLKQVASGDLRFGRARG